MFTLNCKGKLFTIKAPVVMGIINVNQDSFYAGSRHTQEKSILQTAETMLRDGASVLDVGGQSTRPGSRQLPQDEELRQVIPAIAAIRKTFPDAYISVDTFYGAVATAAVSAGADIINDISAGSLDPQLWPAVAALRVPYVLMHLQGKPATMQQQPFYTDVTREVLDYFIEKKAQLKALGIEDVIIDPGYGFGKTISHNFTLMRNQQVFEMLDCPLLMGISRKSTIYKTLKTDAAQALNGTTVLHTIGLLHGAQILRAHDVKEAMETIQLVEAYRNNE